MYTLHRPSCVLLKGKLWAALFYAAPELTAEVLEMEKI